MSLDLIVFVSFCSKANIIEDINEWHNGLHLYPLAKPYIKLD